ncbi:hypothetical protein EDD18DRAFT_1459644 [Armillaria luteobubalina]|uniref:Uncharacterized protein n=1 Tax=Armillaria luteobubalina TaxID=153913 RepID=A0AA39QDN8_9AGAR|nr:hypothetical protein EDD18DRAFT_1459644 [Armillaria luteobubalina]
MSLDELKKEMDAQSKAINALKQQFEKQKEDLDSLKKYYEDAEQMLMEQLKFEVLNRFCGGLTDILHENISDLKALLYVLSVELENPRLAYAPVAFVFFPPRLHLNYAESLKCIPSTSEVTFGSLSTIVEDLNGDIIQLLVHLWVIRPDLADKQSIAAIIARLVPDSSFALETLYDIIHDASQQALIEKNLSLWSKTMAIRSSTSCLPGDAE